MSNLRPGLRVFVIDDEQIVADTLVQILTMHGYKAKGYYSGEAALADASEFRPQVILSDVHMRSIDGIETARRIQVFLPACRMILFTASVVRTEIHRRIRELGFEFLPRPLHPREVLALLEDNSNRHRAGAQMACSQA